MKKLTFLFVALLVSFVTFAQVKISTGGGNPNASSMLEVESTTKGFLPPRMTTAQRNAIASPADGLIIFNTTTGCPNYRQNGIWYEWCGTLPLGTITALSCSTATHNGTLRAGVAASGVNSVVAYTGGNSGTHNGQTVTSTGVTGLTATLAAGTFANGAATLSYTITGTPSAAGTASFALNIGGQNCTLERTVLFNCGTSTVTFTYKGQSVTYGTVVAANNKCWLDRNLGATQLATSSSDAASYGDLFQWGRGDDGHQNRNSGTTNNLSTNDIPGNSLFITVNTTPNDWRSPANPNLWQGVNGINNPCPNGFRLPTGIELEDEINSWVSFNSAGAFASPLKLPSGGFRLRACGFSTCSVGMEGYYFGTAFNGGFASIIYFSTNSLPVEVYINNDRVDAGSVRCIKD
jgi:hypothetical protein